MHRFLFRCVALCAMFFSIVCAASASDFTLRQERIPGWDGTPLAALVLVPRDQGPGPFPLLVMPGSWAMPELEYLGRGAQLAGQGYIVISYTSRGFHTSGGQIDIAGAATVEDVSAVIDWALANTPADAGAIGASGISYGAGTSLLAAERDPRIKAVAALSGWADLEASLYANRTVSTQAVAMLVATGVLTGRPGPELAQITAQVARGDYAGAVQDFLPGVPERSPVSGVEAINENGTAVLLANAFNDGLFPPNQYVDFFERLQVPKQLLFVQGDHATAELPGTLGLPNTVYDAVTRWFDHHLKGLSNGVEQESPVRLSTPEGQTSGYADWDQVQAGATRYGLGQPSGLLAPTGALLASTTATGWNQRIFAGVPTLADSGTVMVSGLLQGLNIPTTTSIPLVSRANAGVWIGPSLPAKKRLAGSPHLRLTVTPSHAEVSLFAYLYAMDAFGIAELLSHKPVSLHDATPGVATTLELDLEATARDIPAGKRLVLVVDSHDLRYAGVSTLGDSVRFSSPAQAPSELQVPLH